MDPEVHLWSVARSRGICPLARPRPRTIAVVRRGNQAARSRFSERGHLGTAAPQRVRAAAMPEPERTATVATRAAQPTEQLVAAPGATCGVSCGKSWVQCAEGCKG